MYFAYVLKSEKDGILYKGSTGNLEKRLKQHNQGKVRFTSGHMPWRLVYFEDYKTRAEAVTREKFLKTGAGREFLKELGL